MNLAEAKEKLEKIGQAHLLDYYDELDEAGKAKLLNQIETTDFSVIRLEKDEAGNDKFEPIDVMKAEEIDKQRAELEKIGIEALKEGKVGLVLLAGGQGTRLGFDGPKGTLNIGKTHELYIFECLINNLMEVVNKCGCYIPLFIMTSEKNNAATVKFFREHNFFGYDENFVAFFIQEMAPSVDYEGKVYMEAKDCISLSPNGNGGWFKSLYNSPCFDTALAKKVEWLNVFAVDNVLQRMGDPAFIGATLKSGFVSGAKVIKKADPDEKVGVMCLRNGRPSIVEYYELTKEMRDEKDANGEYAYNYGVILNYLFRVKELVEIVNKDMPLHVVEKKIPYMDKEGVYHKPEKPNGYKFELLVLDMIEMLDNCMVYEVIRNKEFAPIKNKEGVDSIVSATALLEENGVVL